MFEWNFGLQLQQTQYPWRVCALIRIVFLHKVYYYSYTGARNELLVFSDVEGLASTSTSMRSSGCDVPLKWGSEMVTKQETDKTFKVHSLNCERSPLPWLLFAEVTGKITE